jgi:hypothetical protein
MRRASSCLCGVVLLLLTGCAGSDTKAAPAGTPPAAVSTPIPLPTCAPVRTKPYRWPAPVPPDLPKLPAVTLEKTRTTTDGLFVVQFSTSTSLRDGVLFIIKALPAAGYFLGRGDAEATEADAPFNKGELRGVLRGAAVGVCRTQWILGVTRKTLGTGTPLLPAHTGPSPSPLPFG